MTEQAFAVPIYFDYAAAFLLAITGALVGARRGYDISGVFILALVCATGGGLIRDGLFIQDGPPLLVRTPVYLILIILAVIFVLVAGARRLHDYHHFWRVVHVVDALAMGAYAVIGMQISLIAGLSLPWVILVGVVNATGGGFLRDLFTMREPEVFKPGTMAATAVFVGCLVFLSLEMGFGVSASVAAWPTIAAVFIVREISVRYNLRTYAVADLPKVGKSRKDEA